jgi:hypothetical protein
MIIKFVIVFILGLLEQIGYTFYLLVYFSFYLFIIMFALNDVHTVGLLLTYALSAAVGNYAVMRYEVGKKK